MKKLTSLVLVLVCILGLVGCSQDKPNDNPDQNISNELYTFKAEVLEVHGESLMVKPEDGSNELSSSDKITFSIKDVFDEEVNVGDIVKITYNGIILESYPAQIHISKLEIVEKVQESTNRESYLDKVDFGIAYVGWTDSESVTKNVINQDKFVLSDYPRIPLYHISTLKELNDFNGQFVESLNLNSNYDGGPSFYDISAEFGSKFFEEREVFVAYVTSGSGSNRFGLTDVFVNNNALTLEVNQTNSPEVGTDDMAGWFVVVDIPKTITSNFTEFDAIMGLNK